MCSAPLLTGIDEYKQEHKIPTKVPAGGWTPQRLSACVNSATRLQQTLVNELHFPPKNVTLQLNVQTADDAKQVIQEFRQRVEDELYDHGPKALVLFYFCGHGVELNGKHELVLADNAERADLDPWSTLSAFEDYLLDVDFVRTQIQQANPCGLNVFLIDACRDKVQIDDDATVYPGAAIALEPGAGCLVHRATASGASAWQPQVGEGVTLYMSALLAAMNEHEPKSDRPSNRIRDTLSKAGHMCAFKGVQQPHLEEVGSVSADANWAGGQSRSQMVDKVGPFALDEVALNSLRIGMHMPAAAYNGHKQTPRFHYSIDGDASRTGCLSPLSPITVDKATAGIPESATHFAFVYPLAQSDIDAIVPTHVNDKKAPGDRFSWLIRFGGFAYFEPRGFQVGLGANNADWKARPAALPYTLPAPTGLLLAVRHNDLSHQSDLYPDSQQL